jgi:hypothetical protein
MTLQQMAAGPITNKVISSRKPKASTKLTKGTAPPAVTKEGTYYRAINVWFDERNCTSGNANLWFFHFNVINLYIIVCSPEFLYRICIFYIIMQMHIVG